MITSQNRIPLIQNGTIDFECGSTTNNLARQKVAEILKENIAATENRKRADAEEEARQERIRKLYKALGDATGLDTEKAYREGTEEREAIKRAEKEKAEAILKGRVADTPR